MKDAPLISVVLGTYNRLKFLKLTIDSIRKEITDLPAEIIVVDGGSTDGTLQWLVKQKDLITIVQHNRGKWNGKDIKRRSWGYFMNLGFKCAQGKYVCMLSDDCLVIPGAIVKGYNLFEEELSRGNKVGAMAFYWRNWPEQKKYWVCRTLSNNLTVNHGIYLKEALDNVNYIDEDYLFYHGDSDLCLKIWSHGYAVIESPDSYIEHFSHANITVRQSNLDHEKNDWDRFLKKWEGKYYNKEQGNIGCWVEKEYTDLLKTSEMFRKAVPVLQKVKSGVKRIIKNYANS